MVTGRGLARLAAAERADQALRRRPNVCLGERRRGTVVMRGPGRLPVFRADGDVRDAAISPPWGGAAPAGPAPAWATMVEQISEMPTAHDLVRAEQ